MKFPRCKYRLPKYKACAGMLLRSGTKACGLKTTSMVSPYCAEHKKAASHEPFIKAFAEVLEALVFN
jgi:hypothetical protein